MPAATKTTSKPAADVVVDGTEPTEDSHTWRDTVHTLLPSTVSLLVHTVILMLLAIVTYEETSQEISRLVALPPPVET